MRRAILNKLRKQHPTKQQVYGHLPPISKTTQIRWTRHTGHCWRSKDELISNVLLWTPSHGRTNVGWQVRTYLQQLCTDTECSLENRVEAMDVRDGWGKRIREIRAISITCIYNFVFPFSSHTHTHIYIYMKKIEKQNILNVMNLFDEKPTLKRFGFDKPSPGL